MKKTSFFAILLGSLALIGVGCFRIPTPDPASPAPSSDQVSFGTPVTLSVAESITYGGGLDVLLKEISDSRCPANVEPENRVKSGFCSAVLVDEETG